jgi:arogenate dehydrogenase (NADP+)
MGLIGGSLGLDLQAAGAVVHGLVHRQATAERATARGLATRVSTETAVLRDCAIVILALPLDRLLEPDPTLLAALPPGAVVTDVGSVKRPVLERWGDVPGFVGSHPMAGTAEAGVEAGRSGLFRGRPWVATPDERTDPGALAAVRQVADALGARWRCCSPADHDMAVALISHLPVLVSAALLQTADRGAAAEAGDIPALVRSLASSGFADTTRVGGGNPELGTLMARCNRQAVRLALARYRQTIAALEALVESGNWQELRQELGACATLREEFGGGNHQGG